MANEELALMGLVETANKIRDKEISPVEVTSMLLERIERLDPDLNTYVTVASDLALTQAQEAEKEISAGNYKGLLHGIPVACKDIIDTAGVRTTCGSKLFIDHVPDDDAAVIERFKQAGAVTIGKLTTTEFALYGYADDVKVPVNPWSADHWAGVSSSGSGASVAAGLCYASLGTDTGGSIRFPSAACGVVGLKPTFGKISRHGVFPLANTLDHVGPMTRRVADSAAVLSALEGWDPRDPCTRNDKPLDYSTLLDEGVNNLTIGIDENLCTEGIDPLISEAVFKSVSVLRDLGVEVKEVDASGILAGIEHLWPTLAAEAAIAHKDLFPARAEEYGPVFRDLLEIGNRQTGDYIADGNIRRYKAIGAMAHLLEGVDVLLLPATAMTPIPVVDFPPQQLAPVESFPPMLRTTGPFNFTGNPTINLTCGFTDDGLPMALQFAGRMGDELTILQLAHAYEQVSEWHKRRPPLA